MMAFLPRLARQAGWLVLALGLSTSTAHAATLRCANSILREGAHMFEVSERCGAPLAEYSRLEYLHPQVVVYVDEWVYRFGTNKFQRLLRFENGRLQRIRTLDKPRIPETALDTESHPETGTVHRISW